jgi:NADH-quinone oxidoreductase subunit J
VAIILMFGIMLTRNIQGDDTTIPAGAWRFPALVAGLFVFAILAIGINNAIAPVGQGHWASLKERPSIAADAGEGAVVTARREAVNNMARAVGNELLTRYVVGFEVAGLLLTAALVGAIALAHREEDEPDLSRRGDRRAAGRVAGSAETQAAVEVGSAPRTETGIGPHSGPYV